MAKYRALVGFNYVPPAIHARITGGESIPREKRQERRVEAGEVVSLPKHAVAALRRMGAIEEVTGE